MENNVRIALGQSKMKGVPATPVKSIIFCPFGAIHSPEPSNTLLSSAANNCVLQVPQLQQPPWPRQGASQPKAITPTTFSRYTNIFSSGATAPPRQQQV